MPKTFSKKFRKKEDGFTLVELLVVMSIIGILFGLVLTAVNAARDAARRTICQANMRQLTLAMILEIDTKNRLPENRFTLDLHRNLVKENMWMPAVLGLIQPSLPINQSSPSFVNCPNGRGVRRFYRLPTVLNGQPIESNFSETTDYVGNGGLISARQPGGKREQSQYRGGVVADVFTRHVSRRPNMLRGGRTHTLAFWESLGSSFLEFQPELSLLSSQEFDSLNPVNTAISSDLDPIEVIPILNAATFVRYHATLAGRQSGYLTYFDTYFDSLGDNSPFLLSTQVVNLSNRFRGPFSSHKGLVPVSFLDGATKLISEKAEAVVMFNIATIQDDQPVSLGLE